MNEKRIARICWNTKGWVKPSGKLGKSKSKDSHEGLHGYGGEEWLFDYDKIIGGYKYGFLEPINKARNRKKYIGKRFDIGLYTINSEKKLWYWVGEILNVVVIDENELAMLKGIYEVKGWLNEMDNDLRAEGIIVKNGADDFFWLNIKFREEDVKLLDTPIEIEVNEEIHSVKRYTFLTEKYYPKLSILTLNKDFAFKPSQPQNILPTREYERISKRIELTDQHSYVCDGLYKLLVKEFGVENIGCEQNIGNGCRVDMVIKKENSYSFIEVKTYVQLRYSIRMAIGQLLEYTYWIDNKDVVELVVVSFQKIDAETSDYLKRVRERTKINIHYWQFDNDKLIKN